MVPDVLYQLLLRNLGPAIVSWELCQLATFDSSCIVEIEVDNYVYN